MKNVFIMAVVVALGVGGAYYWINVNNFDKEKSMPGMERPVIDQSVLDKAESLEAKVKEIAAKVEREAKEAVAKAEAEAKAAKEALAAKAEVPIQQ